MTDSTLDLEEGRRLVEAMTEGEWRCVESSDLVIEVDDPAAEFGVRAIVPENDFFDPVLTWENAAGIVWLRNNASALLAAAARADDEYDKVCRHLHSAEEENERLHGVIAKMDQENDALLERMQDAEGEFRDRFKARAGALEAALRAVMDELAHHGHGDMHYGPTPRPQRLVDLEARIGVLLDVPGGTDKSVPAVANDPARGSL